MQLQGLQLQKLQLDSELHGEQLPELKVHEALPENLQHPELQLQGGQLDKSQPAEFSKHVEQLHGELHSKLHGETLHGELPTQLHSPHAEELHGAPQPQLHLHALPPELYKEILHELVRILPQLHGEQLHELQGIGRAITGPQQQGRQLQVEQCVLIAHIESAGIQAK